MEKNQGKINLSTVFLILSIVIIIIMGLFMYNLYKGKLSSDNSIKELNDKISTLENSNTQDKNEEQNTNKLESLDIKSDYVRKLYNYVAKFSYYDELIAYQSGKITEKDMTNHLKLLTIFNNLEESDATRIEYQSENEYAQKRKHIIYSKDIIENKAKEIFGNEVKIIHENASPYDGYTIKYQNNEYDCYDYEGGGAVPWEYSESLLTSAEKDDAGTIYIYDKYVHLYEVDNIQSDGTNIADSYDIYSSSDKKEKLASKVDFVKNHIYDDLKYIDSESEQYNSTYIQNIEKYLGKELTKYKHTYKQNSDGTYYWYSTEPIS